MTRYVIYHPKMGVYVGEALGLGFWSKLDPVGQNAAPTFESVEQALAHADWMNTTASAYPVEVPMARVQDAQRGQPIYAFIPEIEAAGLPSWDPHANPREEP